MRFLLDKIFRACIKLCMLTGVTFLVTACYAPANPPEMYDDTYRRDQQQVEQQLAQEASVTPPSAENMR